MVRWSLSRFAQRGPGACSAGCLDRCFYKGEKSFASVGNTTTIPRFTARGLVALLRGKGIWTEIFSCLFDDDVSNWYYMSSNGGIIVELKLESKAKSSLFLDVTEHKLVDIYWRFETTCRSSRQGWSGPRK